MRWRIACVGRPKLPFARAGIDEYLGRIAKFAPVELVAVRPGPVAAEAAALLERTAESRRVALDPRGELLSSREFAERLGAWQASGARAASLIVGGADGLAPAVRARSELVWSLGRITLQHELALLVAVEQLYRAYAILAGLPYHRE